MSIKQSTSLIFPHYAFTYSEIYWDTVMADVFNTILLP